MKYIKLYTGKDNRSHFIQFNPEYKIDEPLGKYSKKYPVTGMMFRSFTKGLTFDFHTAPEPQYIIYLNGEVEVETSSGEKCVFTAGDVLYASDVTGEGHITRTLTDGFSIIITTEEFEKLKITAQEEKTIQCRL